MIWCSRSWKLLSIFLPLLNSSLFVFAMFSYLSHNYILQYAIPLYLAAYVLTSIALSVFALRIESFSSYSNGRMGTRFKEALLLSIFSFLTIGTGASVKLGKISGKGPGWVWIASTSLATLGFINSFWMYFFLDRLCFEREIDDFSFSV